MKFTVWLDSIVVMIMDSAMKPQMFLKEDRVEIA